MERPRIKERKGYCEYKSKTAPVTMCVELQYEQETDTWWVVEFVGDTPIAEIPHQGEGEAYRRFARFVGDYAGASELVHDGG